MGNPDVSIGVDDGREKENWVRLFPSGEMVLSYDW